MIFEPASTILFIGIMAFSVLLATLINYYHKFTKKPVASTFPDDIYHKIKPTLDAFEERRRRLKFLSNLINYIIFIGVGYLCYRALAFTIYDFLILPALLLLPLLLIIKFQFFRLKKFTKEYKTEVMQLFVKLTHESFELNPTGYIAVSELEKSGLYAFPEYIKTSNVSGEDHIQGNIEGIKVQVSDLEVFKGEQKEVGLVFSGNFMIAEFPDDIFRGETYVIPDFEGSGLMKEVLHTVSNKKTFKVPGERVDFRYPDFEKVYDVVSTNAEEAKYLIDKPMMEFLLQLDRSIHDKVLVALSMKGRYIYMGVLFNYLKLEPSLHHPVNTPFILERIYLYMNLLIAMVRHVKKTVDLKSP